ncbi:MAG TPA: tetratricopeptide repeat protein [Candidatus Eremiobacteraceae bacterium]|nr:tetratricopeptide repeat protein [Candidatus Eremiobacteraceae bacterium]
MTSAREAAARDGLRLSVPQFFAAVDAFVSEGRPHDAQDVLADMLSAKEKVRGFFLGKREQSALGKERGNVANRFARIAFGSPPTEQSLDLLNQLALEFADDFDIRIANAEALRQAGYLLDSLDEYQTCKSMRGDASGVDLKLADVYAQLGRFDESADALSSVEVDDLARRRAVFDGIVAAFTASDSTDNSARKITADKLAGSFESLIRRDPSDASLWASLREMDPSAADEVRARLNGAPTSAPREAAAAAPAAPARIDSSPPAIADGAASVPQAPPRPSVSGLASFTKRKALDLIASGEFEAASRQLERVISMSPDRDALEMLMECYLALDRHDDAARIGVRIADEDVAAGNRPAAIATLTSLSKKIADPTVEQRRVELMQSK